MYDVDGKLLNQIKSIYVNRGGGSVVYPPGSMVPP